MHDSGVDFPPLSLLPLPGVGTASSKTKQMLSSGFVLGCMVEWPRGSFTLTSRPCPRSVKTLGQGAFGNSGTGHRCWCVFFVLVFLSSSGHVNVQWKVLMSHSWETASERYCPLSFSSHTCHLKCRSSPHSPSFSFFFSPGRGEINTNAGLQFSPDDSGGPH